MLCKLYNHLEFYKSLIFRRQKHACHCKMTTKQHPIHICYACLHITISWVANWINVCMCVCMSHYYFWIASIAASMSVCQSHQSVWIIPFFWKRKQEFISKLISSLYASRHFPFHAKLSSPMHSSSNCRRPLLLVLMANIFNFYFFFCSICILEKCRLFWVICVTEMLVFTPVYPKNPNVCIHQRRQQQQQKQEQ